MTSPIGIGMVAPGLSGRSTLWMRRQLEALVDDVSVVVTGPEDSPADVPRGCRSATIPGETALDRWPRLGSLARQWMLFRALRAPDVRVALVHYVTMATAYRRVWPRLGVPLFVHCHGYDVTWDLADPATGNRRHAPEYVDAVRSLIGTTTFIANSRWTMNQLREIGIPDDAIRLKYFGIETPDETPERPTSAGQVEILYLGRLVDFKGPVEVIDAFDLAREQGLSARLTMAGDGPLRPHVEHRRERSPYAEDIEMPGAVTGDVGARLRARSHLFTAHNVSGPSRQQEAFGISNLEALAEGLPVVGTRSGAVPEVVRHGETGLLVDPGDVEGHARALVELGQDEEMRVRFGRQAHADVRERFNVEQELVTLRAILSEKT